MRIEGAGVDPVITSKEPLDHSSNSHSPQHLILPLEKMLSRKRSSKDSSPVCKRSKVSEPVSILPPIPEESSVGDNLVISEKDWLTAICQSLGDDSAIDVPLPSTENLHAKVPIARAPSAAVNMPNRPADEVTTRKSSEILQEWNLDNILIVSLHRTEWKLHLHIKKNSQHIVMTIPTYYDFKNHLPILGLPFERPSVICNNQLAVFVFPGKLILQQIFRFEHFKLKQASLELNYDDEVRLLNHIEHIDKAIKVALFESVLPSLLVKMSNATPNYVPSDLLQNFMLVVNNEISRNVKFPCYGCKQGLLEQENHMCMSLPYKDQCYVAGEDSILLIDTRRIVKDLKEKNIVNFLNCEFFKSHTYDIFRSYMEM